MSAHHFGRAANGGMYRLCSQMSLPMHDAIAGMALRKEAKVWYHFARNPDSPNRVTTWKEFTTQLRDNFCPIDPIKVARDRIADLRQVSSVRDYTSRFRQLTNIITNMSETEKLDRYVRGLKPRTRQEVDMKEPQTFIEAVKIAERIDFEAGLIKHCKTNINGFLVIMIIMFVADIVFLWVLCHKECPLRARLDNSIQ